MDEIKLYENWSTLILSAGVVFSTLFIITTRDIQKHKEDYKEKIQGLTEHMKKDK